MDYNPSSHSFKLSDRAGTNIYSPYRDGPVSSGWRALPNAHNTMAPNASLHFSWKGTAITINGYANSSQGPPAYMLSLDGQPPTREVVDEGRAKAEVLLSKTGLPLAYHTIVLSNIAGGNLTVKDLLLSISTGATRSVFLVSLYKPAADMSWHALERDHNRRNHWLKSGLYSQSFLHLQWKLVPWGYAIPFEFVHLTDPCGCR
jgi:hypothetical protein